MNFNNAVGNLKANRMMTITEEEEEGKVITLEYNFDDDLSIAVQ